jgi:hypothetical protein
MQLSFVRGSDDHNIIHWTFGEFEVEHLIHRHLADGLDMALIQILGGGIDLKGKFKIRTNSRKSQEVKPRCDP